MDHRGADEPRTPHTRAWQVGVDVGKRQDRTAICVARVIERPSPLDGQPETAYVSNLLEPLPLGKNYMDQAQELCVMLAGLRERSIAERGTSGINFEDDASGSSLLPRIRVYIDESGVGDAFCDAVERILRLDRATPRVELLRIRFVAGEHYKRVWEHGGERGIVGKEFIARRLVTVVKSHCLTLPARLAGRLDTEDELHAYEARMREEDGHTTYGAQAPGTHDDLLTAAALAVLETGLEHIFTVSWLGGGAAVLIGLWQHP